MSDANVIADIQSEIVAKKDKVNSFGKYKYRTAEGILEAVKPVVNKHGMYIRITDRVEAVGNSLFLIARAELVGGDGVVSYCEGVAMHALEKKGMDTAQVSGATSSYARKYALCGLFGIDDADQDIDANATHGHNCDEDKMPQTQPKQEKQAEKKPMPQNKQNAENQKPQQADNIDYQLAVEQWCDDYRDLLQGKPMQLICDLQSDKNARPDDWWAMYNRTKDYLGRKGVKVV